MGGLFGMRRKPVARRQPKVLLAWEIGAGFTHARNALGVVSHLARAGVSCTFATADPRFEPWFRAHATGVVQTYLWPSMRAGSVLPAPRPARGLTDILANYGALDPANLAGGIAHYDTLFDLVQPDLVLCENAFAAQLAARGRIPTFIYGSTLLFMPPVIGDGLAPIDPAQPELSWLEDEVLDGVNAALAASARAPLPNAAAIMDCAGLMPFGPAAFDPYADLRSEAVLPPYCPDLPPALPVAPGDETVVYLHESTQLIDKLMAAMLALPGPLRLYIPGLSAQRRAQFEAAGHRVAERMLPLEEIARSARCLIHHGGVTLTAAALALGIPQVILARFYENGLAGAFTAEQGHGQWRRVDEVDSRWLGEAVAAMTAGGVVSARSRGAAPEFRSWFSYDPTYEVAIRICDQLGVARPEPAAAATDQSLAPI